MKQLKVGLIFWSTFFLPVTVFSKNLNDTIKNVSDTIISQEEEEEKVVESIYNTPDSVFSMRFKELDSIYSIPIEYHSIYRNFIALYAVKKQEKTQRVLHRTDSYFSRFENETENKGMPHELKFLAVIESALKPDAISRVGAVGMWQFMYPTAKEMGLRVTPFCDERMDVFKSTKAALKYLDFLYKKFGDWKLALAAYNSGQGRVRKAIRRSGYSDNFWEIYKHLPRETRGYIPSFFAVLYLYEFYENYGFTLKSDSLPSFCSVEEKKVSSSFSLIQASKVLDIPLETLKYLNPQYFTGWIPSGKERYVYLPETHSERYDTLKKKIHLHNPHIENKKKYEKFARISLVHKVRKGETLGHIAQRYRVRVSDLRAWNGIRGNLIRVNQKLRLYITTPRKRIPQNNITKKNGHIYYTVLERDSLWSISKKFSNVSIEDLKQQNPKIKNNTIYPGEVLVIKDGER